jgi:hypothetical protein
MKNRTIATLLTVIAVLLGANLVVMATGTTFAQERGRQPERPAERQAERPAERPGQPAVRQPQRTRCVGITSIGNNLFLAFDDGTVEHREIPPAANSR